MESLLGHFQGKGALSHVAEAQAKGLIAASEIHGTEIPGSISAGSDAARETTLVLLLLGILFTYLHVPLKEALFYLILFVSGWILWKGGRSAWLGWSRLERLHRILSQERWEIEHNREQEKEELTALYAAKGLQGDLLKDVIDVLMADQDRLLKIMVEEELGLSLEVHEHPLKQGLGAALGALTTLIFMLVGYWIAPLYGMFVIGTLIISSSAALSAHYENNRIMPAIIWNLGLIAVGIAPLLFLLEWGGRA